MHFCTDNRQPFSQQVHSMMKDMEDKFKDVVGMEALKATLLDYLRDSLADRLRLDVGAQ